MAPEQTVVLVVEDEEHIRSVLTEVLAEVPGRSVTGVGGGAEALAFVDTVRPDLIVLDCMMPGIDGFTTYKLLRERTHLTNVPVLFISAMDGATIDARIAGIAGPVNRIGKPFQLQDLDAAVEEMLRVNRALSWT